MKYGLNKMNTKLFTQQVVWCGGNWVEFPSLGSKDQASQMTFVVVNDEILIKYFFTYLDYLN